MSYLYVVLGDGYNSTATVFEVENVGDLGGQIAEAYWLYNEVEVRVHPKCVIVSYLDTDEYGDEFVAKDYFTILEAGEDTKNLRKKIVAEYGSWV